MGPIAVASAPRAVPAGPSARRAGQPADRPGVGGALGLGVDPADLVGVHRDDGRAGPAPRHRGRDPERQLHRRSGSHRHYPVLYTGQNGRVAHELILDCRGFKKTAGHRGRGHREAPDGLRLPRADDVVPGAGHADGRADRERVQGRARPVLRRDDRDPRRRSPRSRPARWTAPTTRSRTRRTPRRQSAAAEWDRPYSREQAAFPAPWLRVHKYWPPVGAGRQRLRRSQPGLRMSSDRGL